MPISSYYYKSLFMITTNKKESGVKMGNLKPGAQLFRISDRREVKFMVNGLLVVGSLNLPKHLNQGQTVPCLITFPGWKGDRKGRQKFELGVELIKAGWAHLRLDPPAFGMSDGNPQLVTLGLYANTIRRAIRLLAQSQGVDPERIAVHGTSVGGSAAIMAAASDPRIKALVLWAPRSDYHDTPPDLYKVIGGVNRRLRRSGLRYDFYRAAAKFGGPVLIVHGGSDTIVNPGQSKKLLSAFASNRGVGDPLVTLRNYQEAGHRFQGFEARLIADTISCIKELWHA